MARRLLRIALPLAVVALVAVVAVRLLVADVAPRATTLAGGPRGGCPATPNCVSSRATHPDWSVEPLVCDAPTADAVAAVGRALPDGTQVLGQGHWLVRTRVFGFPDDLVVAPMDGGLEVLSASRVGAGDLGTNRARVEALRDALAADPVC